MKVTDRNGLVKWYSGDMGKGDTASLYVKRYELRKPGSEKSRKWGEKPEEDDDEGDESYSEDDYEDDK
ncbi:hypothetical protein DID88_000868 [Monilinia fructigena]|uniref:Uncharacterized protein n=1 Tax=Monilinia fructigena TaxID=38457 RepID=A0A395IYG8_9HELO|nr:hypothetical protein DID88_000868 [Monilinia fructigena]